MTQAELTQLRQRAVDLAKALNPRPKVVLELVGELKRAEAFDVARRLLDGVRPALSEAENAEHGKAMAQAHALCTYKDKNLSPDKRYLGALAILDGIGLRDEKCADAETLGLGAAIYKRLWESGGQAEYLHAALSLYRASWTRDPDHDLGWGGVNAAYLLDRLAFGERASARLVGVVPVQAESWEMQARWLREGLRADLPARLEWRGKSNEYWSLVTLAEVEFGLGEYARASDWLAKASAVDADNWMRRTTARQLVSLARLQGVPPPLAEATVAQWHPAWRALYSLLGEDTAAALHSWRGKTGLALSGGGFRAALFHLGVLARLAECDVLRGVETLSTVSGGSIVGAHYYLALRHLLQTRPDRDIDRRDYVELVRRLIDDSMQGVEKNLRVRALTNLWANLKMIFSPHYSRSMRMGELYEEHLFGLVKDEHDREQMRRLRDLKVFPAASARGGGADEGFNPHDDNWLRRARVPNLMLNTTSLNSGHNWHFTASWMGEPPGLTGDEIDMNERYRRLRYEDTEIERLRNYPLAYAVAASSCVPAMFEPLPLPDLYPGRTVRLADGGVHDNQGMAGLLDDGCEFILCSDASGQMGSQDAPANGMLGVFWRSDSILQDRLREAQYRDIKTRADNHALNGLFFVHLKQELESEPIDWIGCEDPQDEACVSSCTRYGVDRELQRLISEIRTDLDSFTEVESYALMASGYLMTDHQLRELDRDHRAAGLPGSWGGYDIGAPMWRDSKGQDYWPFAPLIPILGKSGESADRRRRDLGFQLKAGCTMFGRVWRLVRWLRRLAIVAAIAVPLAAAIWVWEHWYEEVNWGGTSIVGSVAVAAVLALLAVVFPLLKYLNPRKAAQSSLLGAAAAIFGCGASNLHLLVFEPLLRRRGSLRRLLRLPVDDG